MKIVLTSVMVDDQEKALRFYTGILGFVKKTDVPMGEFRWLTVVSPEGAAGVELLLEPNHFPPAKVYQKALGVAFRMEPAQMGPVTVATFEDTCGNLIKIAQQ
jgi:catechol 2,3-dioxygenase-like lactoylglutathione lyase family enzyme